MLLAMKKWRKSLILKSTKPQHRNNGFSESRTLLSLVFCNLHIEHYDSSILAVMVDFIPRQSQIMSDSGHEVDQITLLAAIYLFYKYVFFTIFGYNQRSQVRTRNYSNLQ